MLKIAYPSVRARSLTKMQNRVVYLSAKKLISICEIHKIELKYIHEWFYPGSGVSE